MPDAKALAEVILNLLENPEERIKLAEKAHQVATSEMAVLERVYECLKSRGII